MPIYWLFTIIMMILMVGLALLLATPFLIDYFDVDSGAIIDIGQNSITGFVSDESEGDNNLWFSIIIWMGAFGVLLFIFYMTLEFFLRKIELHGVKKFVRT